MYCNNCKTFNSGGRETCESCGKALLDLHAVMAKDRWVGCALRILGIGCLAGGVTGAVVGSGIAIGLASAGGIETILTGGVIGVELGVPCGGVIGGSIGVFKYAPRKR
jgi:hypothetical protein